MNTPSSEPSWRITPSSTALDPFSSPSVLVSFTVTNNTAGPAQRRGTLEVVPGVSTDQSWFSVHRETRTFTPGSTETFDVKVTPPAGAAAGDFSFSCLVFDTDDPAIETTVQSAPVALGAGTRRAMVEVRAPDINRIFDPSGVLMVIQDFTPPIRLDGATGEGFLQSRLLPPGVAGTIGQGMHPYDYRVDMTEVSGPLPASAVRTFSLDFGPIAPLNYTGAGASEVYVITQGGLGTVRPASVTQFRNQLTIHFGNSGVPAGQTSFFMGLASSHPPRDTTAQITDGAGNVYSIAAKAPAFPSP
jgi:hypothetical protein